MLKFRIWKAANAQVSDLEGRMLKFRIWKAANAQVSDLEGGECSSFGFGG